MILEAAGPALAKAGVKLDTVIFSGLAVEAGEGGGRQFDHARPARRHRFRL